MTMGIISTIAASECSRFSPRMPRRHESYQGLIPISSESNPSYSGFVRITIE